MLMLPFEIPRYFTHWLCIGGAEWSGAGAAGSAQGQVVTATSPLQQAPGFA